MMFIIYPDQILEMYNREIYQEYAFAKPSLITRAEYAEYEYARQIELARYRVRNKARILAWVLGAMGAGWRTCLRRRSNGKNKNAEIYQKLDIVDKCCELLRISINWSEIKIVVGENDHEERGRRQKLPTKYQNIQFVTIASIFGPAINIRGNPTKAAAVSLNKERVEWGMLNRQIFPDKQKIQVRSLERRNWKHYEIWTLNTQGDGSAW